MYDDYQDDELTTVSLDSAPPRPPRAERRADRGVQGRYVTVLQVAKLYTPQGEGLCLVRNISAGGMMTNVYAELPIGARVTVEFKSGWVVQARLIWREKDHAGLEFDQPVNCVEVLSGRDAMPLDYRVRAPRVTLEARARVRIGADYRPVTVRNISQGGANISAGSGVEEGEPLVLMVPGLEPIHGSVRWQRADRAGLVFDNPVPLESLARWVADLQRRKLISRLAAQLDWANDDDPDQRIGRALPANEPMPARMLG